MISGKKRLHKKGRGMSSEQRLKDEKCHIISKTAGVSFCHCLKKKIHPERSAAVTPINAYTTHHEPTNSLKMHLMITC